ncbi:hypothetical protein C8R46DRAFT_1125325 [Mycena filopes]|nr:hypothetical protein C8R46DRAFT_1125325 [Mycena filopes]
MGGGGFVYKQGCVNEPLTFGNSPLHFRAAARHPMSKQHRPSKAEFPTHSASSVRAPQPGQQVQSENSYPESLFEGDAEYLSGPVGNPFRAMPRSYPSASRSRSHTSPPPAAPPHPDSHRRRYTAQPQQHRGGSVPIPQGNTTSSLRTHRERSSPSSSPVHPHTSSSPAGRQHSGDRHRRITTAARAEASPRFDCDPRDYHSLTPSRDHEARRTKRSHSHSQTSSPPMATRPSDAGPSHEYKSMYPSRKSATSAAARRPGKAATILADDGHVRLTPTPGTLAPQYPRVEKVSGPVVADRCPCPLIFKDSDHIHMSDFLGMNTFFTEFRDMANAYRAEMAKSKGELTTRGLRNYIDNYIDNLKRKEKDTQPRFAAAVESDRDGVEDLLKLATERYSDPNAQLEMTGYSIHIIRSEPVAKSKAAQFCDRVRERVILRHVNSE